MADERSGQIITFYSYKGGTGRSMALANVAWILASLGKRVLVLDWDLEAPGLHRYFHPFLPEAVRDLSNAKGIIDFVIDFTEEALAVGKGAPEEASPDWYVPLANILPYAIPLTWEFPAQGEKKATLDFVPAGRQDSDYSIRVTSFNWQNFFDRLGGGAFLAAARNKMKAQYDYVLIDSRTGVSDTSGICTVHMPDTLAICFTLNNQSIRGATGVAASVLQQRLEKPLRIFPIPMRVEAAEKEKRDRRMRQAQLLFDRLDVIPRAERSNYWKQMQVAYYPFYAYEEILASFGDTPDTPGLLDSMKALTQRLTGEDTSKLEPLEESERQVYLERFAGTPAAKELVELAERVYRGLSESDKTEMRRLFTRLVTVVRPDLGGEDTRRRASMSALSEGAKKLAPPLIEVGLLSMSEDQANSSASLQPVSEDLVRKWARLRGWIDEDREFLLWRQRMQSDEAAWRAAKTSSKLLHGEALTQAIQYKTKRGDDLTADELEFINESEKSLPRKRNLPRFRDVLAFAFLVLFALSGVWEFIRSDFVYNLRKRVSIVAGFWPRPRMNALKDEFLMTPDGRWTTASLWDYPADAWSIARGVGDDPSDGALLVKSTKVGSPRDANTFYDVSAEFQVSLEKGYRGDWILRLQTDRQQGYRFYLLNGPEGLTLNAWAIVNGKQRFMDQRGSIRVPIDCCKEGDLLRIKVEAKGFRFRHWITLDTADPERPSAGKPAQLDFTDRERRFPFGSVGFVEADDQSALRVQYLRIDPIL